ncbi:cell surface protein [Methanosarcina siciliae HI350]|uniref:Cell surface protein n=1 Tax=Methanosarcina siciliae HI350 TaxID=1434119 RepID=A0A0E3PFH6_9EURY|nr:DUF3344 domain-containing protein [Methanosarcina siciliae]AKB32979.1 cell surface protein [Methanosarcina siciliae HI350]
MFKKENSIKIGATMPIAPLLLLGALVLLFAIASPAAADPYLGGINLTTANGTYGTVTGDLWFDAYPGFDDAYDPDLVWNSSTLPCDPDDVTWARLYIDSYIGNMQANYSQKVTTEFYNGSGYETLGSEIMNTTYTFPADGGSGPVWINDHCNRVTSDFLIWYDVTDIINSSTASTIVNVSKPDGSAPWDGRVKAIVLVVAYNNQSCNVTHYWVNQGHDTDSYLTDYYQSYTGNTTFNTSAVYTPGEANLTVLPLASFNGNYTFNNDDQLTWANPHQGSYFQWQSWNVTSLISSGIDSYMTYGRNEEDDRPQYSGYFKIPLALLTVEDESLIYDFSNETLGRAGICLFAYKSQTPLKAPSANDVPNTEFVYTTDPTDSDEYQKIKYDDGQFQDNQAANNNYAAHRFVFNVSCCSNASYFDAINVTWNGKGLNDDGNGVTLYIWNYNTGAYEQLDICSDAAEQTLTGEKIANLGDYISNDKLITLLAEQNSKTDRYDSEIYTDYVKLVLKQ